MSPVTVGALVTALLVGSVAVGIAAGNLLRRAAGETSAVTALVNRDVDGQLRPVRARYGQGPSFVFHAGLAALVGPSLGHGRRCLEVWHLPAAPLPLSDAAGVDRWLVVLPDLGGGLILGVEYVEADAIRLALLEVEAAAA